jgi:hypothetical protein
VACGSVFQIDGVTTSLSDLNGSLREREFVLKVLRCLFIIKAKRIEKKIEEESNNEEQGLCIWVFYLMECVFVSLTALIV